MAGQLDGKRVAILATDGFEQSELLEPLKALREAGADVKVVAPAGSRIKGWKDKNWGQEVDVDLELAKADAADFDALMLPGGVMNPDKLRANESAIQFVMDFVADGKPIASICHGPWTLINAGAVKGRRVTSWPSIRCDLENAGALWEDAEVVTDRGLVTSRKPDDLPAFNRKMIEEFAEGPHTGARAARSGERPAARH